MVIPLDLSFHDHDHPYTEQNLVQFPDVTQGDDFLEDYQMIIFISEYYMNCLSVVAFYLNMLSRELPIDVDTTILNTALLGQMDNYGYEPDQPCQTRIYAYGEPPSIKISEDFGVSMTSQLGLDFICKKSENSEYFQVFTILTNEIDFTGTLEIDDNLKISMFIDDFKFNVQEITNSQIGQIKINTVKVLINVTNLFFEKLINAVLKEGMSFEWMLQYLGIDYLSV